MKIVVQRVSHASVTVDEKMISKIGKGFLVLLGVTHNDTKENADYLVKKLTNLRVFEDEQGKMNRSIQDEKGEMIVVSQFTLYANCSQGNRPSFIEAARPEIANPLYEYFLEECNKKGVPTYPGVFGAEMKVELLNDGPVTIIIEK